MALQMLLRKDLKELKDAYKGDAYSQLTWLEVIMFKQMRSNVSVIFTDTMLQFKHEEFVEKIRRFQQRFPEYTQRTILHYTAETNKASVIKQVPTNAFFTGYVKADLKGQSSAKKFISNQKAKHPDKKICVLTYKKLITNDKHKIQGKEYTFMGCDAFWFGSAGGINKFEDYDLLVVIGTYMPPTPWYKDMWAETYPSIPFPYADEEFLFETSEDKREVMPADSKLRTMFQNRWIPEIYNCVHRIRPLSHDVEIQWFGKNIPHALERELSVIM